MFYVAAGLNLCYKKKSNVCTCVKCYQPCGTTDEYHFDTIRVSCAYLCIVLASYCMYMHDLLFSYSYVTKYALLIVNKLIEKPLHRIAALHTLIMLSSFRHISRMLMFRFMFVQKVCLRFHVACAAVCHQSNQSARNKTWVELYLPVCDWYTSIYITYVVQASSGYLRRRSTVDILP